jgi:hypothetical protein
MTVRLPSNNHRLAILGRTGSGKTQAGVFHLSRRNYTEMPWLVFDFKGDRLINSIPGKIDVPLGKVPTKPGVYITHPLPDQEEEVDALLWQAWARENVGLYFDEGYMVANSKAFRAVLTQGRSKNVPVIFLSQRPSWISKFALSEADMLQVFELSIPDDRKRVREIFAGYPDRFAEKYQSAYYDVSEDESVILNPVPETKEILRSFVKVKASGKIL